MTSGRAERKAENRAKLVAAARKVFAEKPIGAATARDVVRETDLATGTFYNYFDSIEAVFCAVLEEIAADIRPRLREQRLVAGRSLEERIRYAYQAYFEFLLTDPELFGVLRANAGALAIMPNPPGLAEAMTELREDLGLWVEEGLLPKTAAGSLDLFAAAFVGAGFHVALHASGRDDVDAVAAAEFCSSLFVDGLSSLIARSP